MNKKFSKPAFYPHSLQLYWLRIRMFISIFLEKDIVDDIVAGIDTLIINLNLIEQIGKYKIIYIVSK